ncbi:MAG: L-alanine-DL-glutamate epimerase-like enolase superfamily enzyme, partial [Gammaproteobacteria bacterium]
MATSPTITRIELIDFEICVENIATDRAGSGVHYQPGPGGTQTRFALRVETDQGVTGEYIPPRGRAELVMAATKFLAPRLIGQPVLERERLYREMRNATKHVGELGIGALDIALWDIAG